MLNRDLGRLYAWSQQWFMEFNPLKTKYMRFSRNNNTPDNIEISLNNTQLEEIQIHKHLGLYLTPKLNFETHIDNIISKCSRWIALIWKIQRKYPRFCLENVYTSYIRPILEYGHIVYDNITDHNIRRLEAIQRMVMMNCEEKDLIESLYKGHCQGQKGPVWLIFTYFSILISSIGSAAQMYCLIWLLRGDPIAVLKF